MGAASAPKSDGQQVNVGRLENEQGILPSKKK
jgi:hypothetical protein